MKIADIAVENKGVEITQAILMQCGEPEAYGRLRVE
jgi:hypothetical protein